MYQWSLELCLCFLSYVFTQHLPLASLTELSICMLENCAPD